MVTLRDINYTNYEACADIQITKEQGVFTNDPVWSLVQAAYAEFKDESKLYAIYDDNDIAGLIRLDYFHIGWYEFTNLIIDTAHQGKGIATEACLLVLDKFRQDGRYSTVRIGVSPDNLAAIRVYEKIGFRNTGELYIPSVEDSKLEFWEYWL